MNDQNPNKGKFRTTKVLREGEWVEIPFRELRKGDHFKLFEHDGSPAVDGVDGCIATSNPYPTEENPEVYGINANVEPRSMCIPVVEREDTWRCAFCSGPSPCGRLQAVLEDEAKKALSEQATFKTTNITLMAKVAKIKAVVDEQAKDEGLWIEAVTSPEAYLQQALRHLHRVIQEEEE